MNWFTSKGEFKELSQDELGKLEASQLGAYHSAKSENDKAKTEAMFKKLSEESTKSVEEVRELKKALADQAELIDGFESKENKETFVNEVSKFIEENHDKIKSIQSAGSGLVEFTSKVVGTVTTANGTNPDGIPDIVGTQLAPPSSVGLRGNWVDALTSTVNTNLTAYPYTETLPKDGDFSFLAEEEIKPEIDFEWKTRYAEPVKTAAWIKLSTEVTQDVTSIQSIAQDLLRKKHDLKRQQGILFGTGINNEPTGATVYGRTFVAGSMALGVVNPNIMDAINACITDIYTTHNYEDEMSYMASLVTLNPVDFYLQFVAVKNADGNPLYPTASLFNQVNIGGITIRPERDIPVGKIFVADMSKYNTTNYIGYTVKIGYVNDDFIKNRFVILGESRFHAFVKELDKQAFIYDDIATIKTAITAP